MCDSRRPLNGADSEPRVMAVPVKRQKDAQGAACRDCPAIFNISTTPYWHWSKSMHMHRQSGHRLVLYTLAGVAA